MSCQKYFLCSREIRQYGKAKNDPIRIAVDKNTSRKSHHQTQYYFWIVFPQIHPHISFLITSGFREKKKKITASKFKAFTNHKIQPHFQSHPRSLFIYSIKHTYTKQITYSTTVRNLKNNCCGIKDLMKQQNKKLKELINIIYNS